MTVPKELPYLTIGLLKGRAGPGVVLAPLSIYAGSSLSKPNLSKGMHYLCPCPALEGQGRAGLRLQNKKTIFLTLLLQSECDRVLSCLSTIANERLRKHPLSSPTSIANEHLRKNQENISCL